MFIPRTVTTIAPDAFADSQVIYILGCQGTAAQTFANNNGFMLVTQYGDSAN